MGTFLGHFLPGVGFFMLATWWSFHKSFRYWRFRMTGKPFVNKAAYQGSERFPLETVVKMIGLLIHVLSEIITGYDGDHTFVNNSQHITMLCFFFVNSFMDLLKFYKVPTPPNLDYLSASTAFFMEGFLFSQHLHGRSAVDQQSHTLLYYPVIVAAMLVLLENKYRDSWSIGITRASIIMVHGSWMAQVGFVLYPDWVSSNWVAWDSEEHRSLMILPMVFAWHLMATLIWQGVILFLTYKRAKSQFGSQWKYTPDVTQYSRVPEIHDEIA